jgi:predicted nucleic acid-binding protein
VFDRLRPGLEILPFDEDIAMLAGSIHGMLSKLGQGIGDIDPLIAATALMNDFTLATGNTAHYQRIVDLGFPLKLENWREASH